MNYNAISIFAAVEGIITVLPVFTIKGIAVEMKQ
jgi:hypothetical protein